MKKVLAFGSFDLVHKGHEYFLSEAKKKGDELIVVVARDKTIIDVKKCESMFSENERLLHVRNLGIADKVIFGNLGDKFKVIEKISPDIIVLGYDQKVFTDKLEEEIKKRGLHTKIMRVGSYMPEKYKSSLLKETCRPKKF